MSSLAELALEHARLRLAGRRPPAKLRAAQAAAVAVAPIATPKSLQVLVTGPINHLMFLEGRTWAVGMVASMRECPADLVIEPLAGAAIDRPGSYAAGIQSVIKELKEASSAIEG